MNISADYIEINWGNNMIYARKKLNSTESSSAVLTQSGKKYEYDSFHLNFKTKEGEAENVRIEGQHGVMLSKKVFQKNENIHLMRDILYITDTYFKERKTKNPDYFFKITRLKHYNNKAIITGHIFIYFYKVPFPIPIPFSYISTSENNSTGFIFPNYGECNEGFFYRRFGFFPYF